VSAGRRGRGAGSAAAALPSVPKRQPPKQAGGRTCSGTAAASPVPRPHAPVARAQTNTCTGCSAGGTHLQLRVQSIMRGRCALANSTSIRSSLLLYSQMRLVLREGRLVTSAVVTPLQTVGAGKAPGMVRAARGISCAWPAAAGVMAAPADPANVAQVLQHVARWGGGGWGGPWLLHRTPAAGLHRHKPSLWRRGPCKAAASGLLLDGDTSQRARAGEVRTQQVATAPGLGRTRPGAPRMHASGGRPALTCSAPLRRGAARPRARRGGCSQ
jgi:hypothetical protein